MACIFTIKDGVPSSARGAKAKGSLRTEEKVWVRTLMPTHWIIHAILQSGMRARTPLGSQPRKSLCCIIGQLHYDWVFGSVSPHGLWASQKMTWEGPFLPHLLLLFIYSSLSTGPSMPSQRSGEGLAPRPQRPLPRGLNWSSFIQINEFFPNGWSTELLRRSCCVSAPSNKKLPGGRTLSS